MKWAYIWAHTSHLERKKERKKERKEKKRKERKERKKGYFILTVSTRNVIMAVSSIDSNSQLIKFDHKLPKTLSLRFEFTASLITYDSHTHFCRTGIHCAMKHETQNID